MKPIDELRKALREAVYKAKAKGLNDLAVIDELDFEKVLKDVHRRRDLNQAQTTEAQKIHPRLYKRPHSTF